MAEIVKLKFTLKEENRMNPGERLAEGVLDLDMGATAVACKVLRETVGENGLDVTLDLEVPDGTFPTNNMSSFYSAEKD